MEGNVKVVCGGVNGPDSQSESSREMENKRRLGGSSPSWPGGSNSELGSKYLDKCFGDSRPRRTSEVAREPLEAANLVEYRAGQSLAESSGKSRRLAVACMEEPVKQLQTQDVPP